MPSGGWEARFLYSEKRRLVATEEAIIARGAEIERFGEVWMENGESLIW